MADQTYAAAIRNGFITKPIVLVDTNNNPISSTPYGQQPSNASLPVVPASDYVSPTQRSPVTLFTTTQTGISSTFQSGLLQVGKYTEMLMLISLTAFTGTSVTFKWRTKDSFGNIFTIQATGAQSGTATLSQAVSNFGLQGIFEATAVTVTSMTFTVEIHAK